MFSILDGRDSFYQWDLDRKLLVRDNSIKQVHFCNKTDECSLVVDTYMDGELNLVNVPNILLTTDWRINVYAYDENYTKYSDCFKIVSRTKPADYVYTETEVKNWEDFESRLSELENVDYIALLCEEDMLATVYNADGKIPTDSKGNVILRY